MARDTFYTLYKTGRTDPTFRNIWAFENPVERDAWLNTCSPLIFENIKYWRVGLPVKCSVRYEESFNYDYIKIVNRNDEPTKTKTWFCFIIGREYISNNCTQFTLAIDYVQTFYFNTLLDGGFGNPFWYTSGFITKTTKELKPPRGTTSEYPVPEVDCQSFEWGNAGYSILIYSSVNLSDLSNRIYTSAVIEGVYTACPPYIMALDVDKVSNLIYKVNDLGLTDAISGIYLIPNDYVNVESLPSEPTLIVDPSVSGLFKPLTYEIKKPKRIATYTPHNSELLGYDYSYFTINNGQGETSVWHFEDFLLEEPLFNFRVSFVGSPTIIAYPVNLINTANNVYRQMAIKITQAPSCSYLNDSYRIWLAQTQNSRAAAINGAQLAISQAQEARDKNLSANIEGMLNSAYDWYSGLKSTKEAKGEFSEESWNIKLQNALEGIRGGFNKFITGSSAPNQSLPGDRYFQQTIDSVAANLNKEQPQMPEWVSNIGQAAIRKVLGLEQAYVYDQAVASAEQMLQQLLASYKDKARIPATATGSNAYGDMCTLQQYGFMISVFTPTEFYARQIDAQLTANGHIVNTYSDVVKEHSIFDYYAVISPYIAAERNGRPQYARNMLISILTNGVYLWYVHNGDIDSHIGLPYGIDNPKIS